MLRAPDDWSDQKLSTSPPSRFLMRAEVCTSVHGTDYTSVGSQEAGKLDRSEVEGRVAPGLARWLREVVPGDLRRQLDDGEAALRERRLRRYLGDSEGEPCGVGERIASPYGWSTYGYGRSTPFFLAAQGADFGIHLRLVHLKMPRTPVVQVRNWIGTQRHRRQF